jgi:flagellar biosynthetic protein FliR
MITITGFQIEQYMLVLMFAAVRIFGVFLTAPMFAFRALPMQFRVLLTLLLAFYVFPMGAAANSDNSAFLYGKLVDSIFRAA